MREYSSGGVFLFQEIWCDKFLMLECTVSTRISYRSLEEDWECTGRIGVVVESETTSRITVSKYRTESFEVLFLSFEEISRSDESTASIKYFWSVWIHDICCSAWFERTASSVVWIDTTIDREPLPWYCRVATLEGSSVCDEDSIDIRHSWIDDDITTIPWAILSCYEDERLTRTSCHICLDMNIATFHYNWLGTSAWWWAALELKGVAWARSISVIVVPVGIEDTCICLRRSEVTCPVRECRARAWFELIRHKCLDIGCEYTSETCSIGRIFWEWISVFLVVSKCGTSETSTGETFVIIQIRYWCWHITRRETRIRDDWVDTPCRVTSIITDTVGDDISSSIYIWYCHRRCSLKSCFSNSRKECIWASHITLLIKGESIEACSVSFSVEDTSGICGYWARRSDGVFPNLWDSICSSQNNVSRSTSPWSIYDHAWCLSINRDHESLRRRLESCSIYNTNRLRGSHARRNHTNIAKYISSYIDSSELDTIIPRFRVCRESWVRIYLWWTSTCDWFPNRCITTDDCSIDRFIVPFCHSHLLCEWRISIVFHFGYGRCISIPLDGSSFWLKRVNRTTAWIWCIDLIVFPIWEECSTWYCSIDIIRVWHGAWCVFDTFYSCSIGWYRPIDVHLDTEWLTICWSWNGILNCFIKHRDTGIEDLGWCIRITTDTVFCCFLCRTE